MKTSTWTRRIALATVATATAVVASATSASAVPGADLALAGASVGLMQTAAVADGALYNASHPNVTCGNPTGAGTAVTPGMDTPVAVVKGIDVGEAFGECVSLTGATFDVVVTAEVKWQDANGAWHGTSCERGGSGHSVNGVGVAATEPLRCFYAAGDAGAGRPHALYMTLTNSLVPDVYEGWSNVWQG